MGSIEGCSPLYLGSLTFYSRQGDEVSHVFDRRGLLHPGLVHLQAAIVKEASSAIGLIERHA
jgi:hypothetical protein